MAVIDSLMKNQVDPPKPRHSQTEAEDIWLNFNRNVLQFLQQLPETRYHRFSFEDLMANTGPTLRRITSFLGVPYCSEMENAYEGDRLQSGIGCINLPKRKRVEKELGEKWRHIRLPRPLREETRSLAASLGYSLPRESCRTV